MKRLIKKSEFLSADYFGLSWRKEQYYVEVYKNPNEKEIQTIEKECKETSYGYRGILNNDGLYVWAGEILHDMVAERFKIKSDIHLIILNKNISPEGSCFDDYKLFKKHEKLFFPYGELGYTFSISGKTQLYENLSYDDFFNNIDKVENTFKKEIGTYDNGEPIFEGDTIDESRSHYLK